MDGHRIGTMLTLILLAFFSRSSNAVNRTVDEDKASTHHIWAYSSDTNWVFHKLSSPSHGITYRQSAEDIVYKPSPNYCGTDRYTYTLKKYYGSGGGVQPYSYEAPLSSDKSKDVVHEQTTQNVLVDISSAEDNNIEQPTGYYRYETITVNMNVRCINDRPTITNITNQVINEDSSKTLSFKVKDIETSDGALKLSRTSSNSTLLPVSAITFAGSGSNRTVRMKPAANRYGTTTVRITVSDGKATRTDSFVLTVRSINDKPTITNIPNQSSNEDITKTVSFTVNDIESSNSSLSLTRTSSNSALLPVGNISFGGSGSNRTVIMKPVSNKSGTSTVTITVSDGKSTRSDSFVLSVKAINDTPTITNIPNHTVNEDTSRVIYFFVNDIETSNSSLVVTRTSSNELLIPANNIALGGSGSNRSLSLRPKANRFGTSTIKVTVSDGKASKADTFVLTVRPVNDKPTISNIANTTTNEDTSKKINFTVNDVETGNNALTLSRTSSNTTLLPVNNIVFGGSNSNRSVTLKPAANKSGTATINVSVSDGSSVQSRAFTLTVKAVNDAPTMSNISDKTIDEDTQTGDISISIGDVETPANSLEFSASSDNSNLIPKDNIILRGSGENRTIKVIPAANQHGSATISVVVSDNEKSTTKSFRLAVDSVNDKPSILNHIPKSINQNTTTTITGSDLMISDPDHSSFAVTVLAGDNYSVDNNRVTPKSGFAGILNINVKVTDGITDSEIYVFPLTVNSELPSVKRWNEKGGQVQSSQYNSSVPGESNFYGTSISNSGVNGGASSYNIPIKVVPGRSNMQPAISLSYSSRNGDGVVGVGWGLNAFSQISRCNSTLAQDGYTDGIHGDIDDKLCLNGQRLMVVSGEYGRIGAEYRYEIDNWTTVRQLDGDIDESAYFEVIYPNGTKEVYGESIQSKLIPGGSQTTLSWLLESQEDFSGNNTINYSFSEHGEGELLLDSIAYTGDSTGNGNRSVYFIYENNSKGSTSYIAGGKIQRTKRLHSIQTKYETEVVREYLLTYRVSQASGRTLLTEVTECAVELCREPITFAWSQSRNHYQVEVLATNQGNELLPVSTYLPDIAKLAPQGDMDGNGSRDWPTYFVNAEGDSEGVNPYTLQTCKRNRITRSISCLSGDFNLDGRTDSWRVRNEKLEISYSNPNGTSNWITTAAELQTQNSKRYELVDINDYNGDGWPDIVIYEAIFRSSTQSYAGGLMLYLHTKNSNNPYSEKNKLANILSNQSVQYVGDMNADGLPDLMISQTRLYRFSPATKLLLLTNVQNNGSVGFTEHNMNFQHGLDTTVDPFSIIADINGDGLPDWLGFLGGSARSLQLKLNLGDGSFSDPVNTGVRLPVRTVPVPTGNPYEIDYIDTPYFGDAIKQMDIDSDGRIELIMPSSSENDILVSACQTFREYHGGSRYVPVTRCGSDIRQTHTTNVNNTVTDTATPTNWDNNIYKYVAIKFNENLSGEITGTIIPTDLVASAGNSMVVDALGKGLPDLVFGYGCTLNGCSVRSDTAEGIMQGLSVDKVYFNRNYGDAPSESPAKSDYHPIDMLISAETNYGSSYSWQYLPLSSDQINNLYEVDYEDVVDQEHFHFTSSMYVVASMNKSDGIGGENRTEYQYKGAMYNTQGRGFRGFRSITTMDVERDTRAEVTFLQKFPFSSLVETEKSFDGTSEVPFSIVANDYDYNQSHFDEFEYFGLFMLFNKQSVIINCDLAATECSDSPGEYTSRKEITVKNSDIDRYGNAIERNTVLKDSFGQYRTTELQHFEASDAWPNKRTKATVTKYVTYENSSVPSHDDQTNTTQSITTYVDRWNLDFRKPDRVTISDGVDESLFSECNDVSLNTCRSIKTDYNRYGNPIAVEQGGGIASGKADNISLQTRITSYTYTKDGENEAEDGYFVYETNSHGLETVTQTNPHNGMPVRITAPTGVGTSTNYDAFGRPSDITVTGYPTKYFRYLTTDNDSEALENHSVSKIVTSQVGNPQSVIYQDIFGRTTKTRTQHFDSGYVSTEVHFDSLGRVYKKSVPYVDTSAFIEFEDYDVLDRPGKKTSLATHKENNLTTRYTYSNNTTSITTEASSGNNLSLSRSYNAKGLLMSTIDNDSGRTSYAYDGAGNPIVIKDANNNSIYANYNGLGNKLWVKDPNQGLTTFEYNDFGEVEKEVDANQMAIRYDMDSLGRVYRRISSEGIANFTFNSATGLLSNESFGATSKSYLYDSSARPTVVTTTLDDEDYTFTTSYDSNYGRPKSLEYPNDLTIEYSYNERGYLTHEKNAESGYIYREITSQDAWGNINSELNTDSVLTGQHNFSSRTGQMLMSQVNNGDIQYLDYLGYDSYGNLTEFNNIKTGFEESFEYDGLHRLTQSSTSGMSFAHSIDYSYDAVGNFTRKTDYSLDSADAYQYVSNTNRVSSVELASGGTVEFGYDNKGNQTHRNNIQEITYNTFNKPTAINRLGSSVALFYGSDLMRYKQVRNVNGKTTTTYYINKLFEVEHADNKVTERSYISDIAILEESESNYSITFTHRDRLGSAVTFTDHNGKIVAFRSFDPFGKPKMGDGSLISSMGMRARLSNNMTDIAQATRKGFTDHEHLDEVELIHMNGRVYDYNLGRFMSVDPFIQAPTNTQSVNPYSYIMNNPLAGTDPTGYCAAETGTRIKSCVDVEVTNTDTGEVSTKSMNSKHSNFAGHVADFAASKLGNGAQITGMSATMKNGNTVDLMSQASTSKASVGTPAGDGKARDGDFQINEKPLREMLFDADTYGGAIANLSGSLHDNELRDILGDRYNDYVNELSDAFSIGWDKVILAKSIMAPGFMATGTFGLVKSAESYMRNSAVMRQASQLTRDAANFTFKPFRKFAELPKAQKDACVGIALNLCGSGSALDDLLKPKSPYTLPKPGPSKYAPAGEHIIHPRRFLDRMNASGVD